MTAPPAQARFARWFAASGRSQADVGRELGCSGTHVGYLVAGTRTQIGVPLAVAIQRATATGWDEPAIQVDEWISPSDEAPAESELKPTGTGGNV